MGRIAVRTFRRGGHAVRQSAWLTINFPQAAVEANTTGVLLGVLNAAALALRPFTIVRTRVVYHVESDQDAASQQYRGAVGHVVVSEQASAAGIGSLPKPLINSDGDYHVYEPFASVFSFATAAGFEGSRGLELTVDSKAMRKVQDNEDLVIVAEAASNGVLIQGLGRILVKLH